METVQTPEPASKKLSRKERSAIASDAAKRRWANVRAAKAEDAAKTAAKARKAPAKAAPVKKRPAAPREFGTALKTAEKRLARAIQERAEAAAKYAVLSAEIPSLQRIIQALRDPTALVPQQYYTGTTVPFPPPTLEQIIGDQPIAYQNPPARPLPPVPAIPVPQSLHPANAGNGRGGGGAIGVELAEPEDEDQFLRESGVAGGEWR
jgi:hypothetical protein